VSIVAGRAPRAAVPVVPPSLLRPPVTADTAPAFPSYNMNAAFMLSQLLSQLHERGIHAVSAAGGGYH
jgi:hypothetical protein